MSKKWTLTLAPAFALVFAASACRTPAGDVRRDGTNAGTVIDGGGEQLPPPPPPPTREVAACDCSVSPTDRDGDCEPDAIEDSNGSGSYDAGVDFSDLNNPDTDGDGILDGCEDLGNDGVTGRFPPESSPTNADSDGDGIPDGLEDTNRNGRFDEGETSATVADSDADGIPDGVEDRNRNGVWDCPENAASAPCETDPRSIDTDNDGLLDSIELKSFLNPDAPNFKFCVVSGIEPCTGVADHRCRSRTVADETVRFAGLDGVRGPGPDGRIDDQTCPWMADSDEDGLDDGIEDKNADTLVSTGETDPRKTDSDGDGLADGAEDSNRDGVFDGMTETDPSRVDTDGDGIPDGVEDSGGCLSAGPAPGDSCTGEPSTGPYACNCAFWRDGVRQANETDPRVPDSDGDGLFDGAEDNNGDGVCQLPLPQDLPRASDETCGYLSDSDGDSLVDGLEDKNQNGLIDVVLGETDARRADPDNDCLNDAYEVFSGTNPFVADSDGDGLADGLETDQRLKFDPVTRTCKPIECPEGGERYQSITCPNPLVKDTDGDGFSDGYDLINGVRTGEDEDGDGCVTALETNPCVDDSVKPPVIGDPGPSGNICSLGGDGAACQNLDLAFCSYCSGVNTTEGPGNYCGGDPMTCSEELPPLDPLADRDACPANSPCKRARKLSQALVCADGNVRPLLVLRNTDADYALALPARYSSIGLPEAVFATDELRLGLGAVGHVFQSNDALTNVGAEAMRSIFGGVVKLGTIQLGRDLPGGGREPDVVTDNPQILVVDGSGTGPVVASAGPQPSDVALLAADRIASRLAPLGYAFARTAGGNVAAHDDLSGSGAPGATTVTRATDRFVLRRLGGGNIDAADVKRAALSGLLGGNPLADPLETPSGAFSGPSAEMKILYYKRVTQRRVFLPDGSSELRAIAQYGAVLAVAALDADCSVLVADDRADCRERNERALVPIDDFTNGSALARSSTELGRACDAFEPQKAKADFLVVVDDSNSMQDYVLAVQQAARDVAFKLRANAKNMDWRIALTTSNMGSSAQTALFDAYEPGPANYPELNPSLGGFDPAAAGSLAAYQATAYDAAGNVVPCVYADAFDPTDPRKSPYCCNGVSQTNQPSYFAQCCSLPAGYVTPPSFPNDGPTFIFSDPANNVTAPFETANTLRCYDFPRFTEARTGLFPMYPGLSAPDLNPTSAQRKRHFLDYLCGNGNGSNFDTFDDDARPLWGTRGNLWPPGFAGFEELPGRNRLDGANLLIRNADMLVTQMNRDCTGRDSPNENFNWSPRARGGSAAENMLQAAKRAVERASAMGRTGNARSLRPDAPLITILLSDEEDYSTKYRRPDAARDVSPLPSARCQLNGDVGCELNYCEACFGAGIDGGLANPFAAPSAKSYTVTSQTSGVLRKTSGDRAYCATPIGAVDEYTTACGTDPLSPTTAADPFCASSVGDDPLGFGFYTQNQRYNGMQPVPYDVDENDNTSLAAQASGPNSPTRDSLNWMPAPVGGVSCGCADDCGPCARYLREKQYTDFFGGKCSPPDAANPTRPPAAHDPRRYPRPAVTVAGSGNLVLPLGPVFAITRAAGKGGGAQGACGSRYAGGDGEAYRDVAIATGGRVADICPPVEGDAPNFADFLDLVIVEAQGLGSPYRLRGNPISSTLRVGVMDKNGNFRMLKRSSVSGFDYNPTTNTIAFFSKSSNDTLNQFTLEQDAVAFVSYRVWVNRCSDCALGDECAICTCSLANPECCTTNPVFQCQPPTPCAFGCGPCETCDFTTNSCRPTDVCSNCNGTCTTGAQGPECQPSGCPAGSVGIAVPCGEGELCPPNPLTVCVSSDGIPNTGANCAVTGQPGDCCGQETTCNTGEVCVLSPCAGESCLPSATCRPVSGPLDDVTFCGDCPAGTLCSPVPCTGTTCPPRFRCISSSPGSSASCTINPECSCPGGVCGDCALGQYCTLEQRCESLCANGVSTVDCCTDAGLRMTNPPTTPPLACCPAGEQFDPNTGSCVQGTTSCGTCPEGTFCDPFSGRCIAKGG